MNHHGFFVWGKLTFSCNEYTCLMSAKHQSRTKYQDRYILYIVMGEITKFTSHASWVTLYEKKPHFCSDIWYWNWLKAAITPGPYPACTGTRSAIASDHTSLVVSLILISIPHASLHTRPTLVTTCKIQTGWEIIVTHNAVFRTYRCRDCFGHILSTKVYVSYLSAIMIGNKQLPCIMTSTLQPVKGFVVVCRFLGLLPVSHLLVL
jgi:hypothetical protein